MMTRLWVVERLGLVGSQWRWFPTVGVALTRSQGYQELQRWRTSHSWRARYDLPPANTYRLVQYQRDERSRRV